MEGSVAADSGSWLGAYLKAEDFTPTTNRTGVPTMNRIGALIRFILAALVAEAHAQAAFGSVSQSREGHRRV